MQDSALRFLKSVCGRCREMQHVVNYQDLNFDKKKDFIYTGCLIRPAPTGGQVANICPSRTQPGPSQHFGDPATFQRSASRFFSTGVETTQNKKIKKKSGCETVVTILIAY